MKNLLIGLLVISTSAFAGKIQQQDIKTASECTTAGAAIGACLPLDSQIYVTALGINQQLSTAISSGAFANTFRVPNVQRITSTGIYGVSYYFSVSSASATAGAVYTNNSHNFTVVNTISSGSSLLVTSNGAPLTSGTLTKSSGTGDATITFSSAIAPLYDVVEIVGAGGGGSGGGSGSPVTGGVGGNTNFAGNTCIGGGAGGQGGTAPAGGTCTLTFGIQIINAQGMVAGGTNAASSTQGVLGGNGGSTPFGSGGSGGWSSGGNGTSPQANTGAGGGGGGATISDVNGTGGSAGGYLKFIIGNPSPTYSITIGTHGSGGAAGTGGANGADGADGGAVITEYWQ